MTTPCHPTPMHTVRHILHRTALAALIACTAVPFAHAGLTVTQMQPGDDGVLRSIRTGALDQHWWALTPGNGAMAQARFVETRVSQLIDPASQGLELLHQVADSGWVTTAQRGASANAAASIQRTPVDPSTFLHPASASASLWGNHVRAVTAQQLAMENDVGARVGGHDYPAYSIFLTGGQRASARSAWYDTWVADGSSSHPLTVRLDGSFGHDQPCLVQACGLIIPPGITSIDTRSPGMAFEASFTVLDPDTWVSCDDADACGITGPRPKAVAHLTATYSQDDDDSFPLFHDTTRILDFQPMAGHRYLAIGLMEAHAENGGLVRFDNSFRLVGVGGTAGGLRSSALGGGDLVAHFQSPVPEPGTALLWAAGLAGWRDGAAFASPDATPEATPGCARLTRRHTRPPQGRVPDRPRRAGITRGCCRSACWGRSACCGTASHCPCPPTRRRRCCCWPWAGPATGRGWPPGCGR